MRLLKTVLGAVLVATTLYLILAAPGLLDDSASVLTLKQEVRP